MNDLIFAMIVSFVVSLVAGFIIIPILRKAKAGQQVRDDGPQSHLKKAGTPTMGGIIMIIGIVVTTFIFAKQDMGVTLLAVLPMIAFALVGLWDDVIKLFKKRSLGLRPYQKMILQVILSVVIAILCYFKVGSVLVMPFGGFEWDLGIMYIPFTAVVIIAVVNSVNLTDGLDGLAAGVTAVDSFTFMLIFAAVGMAPAATQLTTPGSMDMAVFSAAVFASCIAFVVFNHYPAKVFMGDTGSFALGGAFAMMGILSRMQLLIPIIGIFFVLSSVSVIIQVGYYKKTHKRVFRMAPLHHHFELGGMHETKVVLMYVLITAAVCAAVLIGSFLSKGM